MSQDQLYNMCICIGLILFSWSMWVQIKIVVISKSDIGDGTKVAFAAYGFVMLLMGISLFTCCKWLTAMCYLTDSLISFAAYRGSNFGFAYRMYNNIIGKNDGKN